MLRLTSGFILILVALVACGWLYLYHPGPGKAELEPAPQQPPQTNFAADREMEYFDPKRALGYLEEVCQLGPRISGTPAMKKQQELLRKHFEALGGKVELQAFQAKQKSQPEPVAMANLVVAWHPDRTRRILICCHYDTRPIADQDARHRWQGGFLGANDGGSGVALLMELGHIVKNLKTTVGVDFAFFDGEEYIFNPSPVGDLYFFGSEHFAQNYQKSRPGYKYLAAVLLDMVGGKGARFPVEQNSWFKAGGVVEDIWKVAAAIKCDAFVFQRGAEVRDDHLALNKVNIPAVDIIDMNYPHWHKLSDVPANCSGESMGQVARVLIAWLPRLK